MQGSDETRRFPNEDVSIFTPVAPSSSGNTLVWTSGNPRPFQPQYPPNTIKKSRTERDEIVTKRKRELMEVIFVEALDTHALTEPSQ